MPARRKLNPKQLGAIDAFLTNGGNIKEALLTAGYAFTTAGTQSHKVWYVEAVQEELARRQKQAMKKVKLTPEWVLKRLMERADSGRLLAPFKKVSDDGQLYWNFTGADKKVLGLVSAIGIEFIKSGRGKGSIDITKSRVTEPDVGAAIRDLMRHLGMFNDKLEVTGSMAERIKAAKAYSQRADEVEDTTETVH